MMIESILFLSIKIVTRGKILKVRIFLESKFISRSNFILYIYIISHTDEDM